MPEGAAEDPRRAERNGVMIHDINHLIKYVYEEPCATSGHGASAVRADLEQRPRPDDGTGSGVYSRGKHGLSEDREYHCEERLSLAPPATIVPEAQQAGGLSQRSAAERPCKGDEGFVRRTLRGHDPETVQLICLSLRSTTMWAKSKINWD